MLKKLFKNITNQSKATKAMSDNKDKNVEEQEVLTDAENGTEVTENEASIEETPVDEMTELKQQIGEAKDKYLRMYAEFENYKRRSMKERSETLKRASQDTMTVILPVLDDFDRAQANADKDEDTAKLFAEGVGLIVNKLQNALQAKGLQAMESTGAAFDSELHEAIAEVPGGEEMKGKIIDTVEKGYTLNGVIIRHAKVVVGK